MYQQNFFGKQKENRIHKGNRKSSAGNSNMGCTFSTHFVWLVFWFYLWCWGSNSGLHHGGKHATTELYSQISQITPFLASSKSDRTHSLEFFILSVHQTGRISQFNQRSRTSSSRDRATEMLHPQGTRRARRGCPLTGAGRCLEQCRTLTFRAFCLFTYRWNHYKHGKMIPEYPKKGIFKLTIIYGKTVYRRRVVYKNSMGHLLNFP